MKTFFISDTHFSHSRMIENGWRSFNSTAEMNEYIIKQWNSVVSENDTVYHLGDICICRWKDYQKDIESQLNGNIIYIKGNHDSRNSARIHRMVLFLKSLEVELVHNPLDRSGEFDYVIHGHIHNSGDSHADAVSSIENTKTQFFNANVEFNDYKPVELQNIIQRFLTKKK